ncbi:MAG: four helix bundle protein [Candidatus Omnitrophica bacterium]|nr:four helix bundle protein [Candidatus Omnitrophota bacterium]
MPTFKDLKIYQEAIRPMLEIGKICKRLPREERFQLIDQATRSSSSVPDNIAEGYTAYYYKDKIHRFYDARKEAGETQNHIYKMERKGYIDMKLSQSLFNDYQQLIKGINGYITYLRHKGGCER